MTVIGDGNTADNTTTEGDTAGATSGNDTTGENGNGSGNQTDPAVTAPVDAGDNQVTVIGDGNTSETADDETGTDGSGGDTTDGEDGTGSGNQTAPGIVAPVDPSGNQVTVLGDDNTQRDTESNTGEEDTDEGDDASDDDPAGDTGEDSSDGPGTGAGTVTGRVTVRPATVRTRPRPFRRVAGPAVAGALPQTGAAAGLVLWGAFGSGDAAARSGADPQPSVQRGGAPVPVGRSPRRLAA